MRMIIIPLYIRALPGVYEKEYTGEMIFTVDVRLN